METDNLPSQPVAEPIPVEPINPKPRFPYTKLLLIVGLFFVIAMAVVAIIYLLPKYKSNSLPPNTTQLTRPSIVPSPSTQDKTTNWQTYTSPDGKYTLKYPDIDGWGQYTGDIFGHPEGYGVRVACLNNCVPVIAFSVVNSSISSIDNYLKVTKGVIDSRRILVDGHEAVQTLLPTDPNKQLLQTYVVNNGKAYILTYDLALSYENISKIPQLEPNVLDTVKFSDIPINSDTQIKSFTSNKFGFTFDYPAKYYVQQTNNGMVNLATNEKGNYFVSIFLHWTEDNLEIAKISPFVDYAIQQAVNGSMADGPYGHSQFENATQQTPINNSYGVSGYKFYFRRVSTSNLDGNNKTEEKTVGPVFLLDLSGQTNNFLKSIEIFSSQEDNLSASESETLDIIVNSLRFKNAGIIKP